MALSVFIHEAGHLLLCLLQKRRVYGLWIDLSGFQLIAERERFSYRQDMALALAGPAASFLFALIAFALIHVLPLPQFFFLLYFNLFLCLVQLVPLTGTDGYCALYALFSLHGDPNRAYGILRTLSRICAALAFAAIFAVLCLTGFHLSLSLFALSFLILVFCARE